MDGTLFKTYSLLDSASPHFMTVTNPSMKHKMMQMCVV